MEGNGVRMRTVYIYIPYNDVDMCVREGARWHPPHWLDKEEEGVFSLP